MELMMSRNCDSVAETSAGAPVNLMNQVLSRFGTIAANICCSITAAAALEDERLASLLSTVYCRIAKSSEQPLKPKSSKTLAARSEWAMMDVFDQPNMELPKLFGELNRPTDPSISAAKNRLIAILVSLTSQPCSGFAGDRCSSKTRALHRLDL